MRWSLRNQILMPMAGLLLVTLLGVSTLNAVLAAGRARGQIEAQLRGVVRIAVEANYPLTDNVLRQIRGLSGAELVLFDAQGRRLAGSGSLNVSELPLSPPLADWQELRLGQPVTVQNEQFFHFALALPRGVQGPGPLALHVFYPESSYSDAFWDAVVPPLIVGSGAMVLILVLAHWFASRLSRPMRLLQSQVERIAHGEFLPLPLPARNDELRDLARAVNRMSEMLADYEDEVRRSEQLRTLGLLRGGIAHQMRNAVTGCRMALDLHRRSLPADSTEEDLETLTVAMRQLSLIEKQLQKFLSEQQSPLVTVETDLAEVIQGVLPLVAPAGEHLGVTLEFVPPCRAFPVRGDISALEQMIGNLLLNALDAAAAGGGTKAVRVTLSSAAEEAVQMIVADTGAGPSELIGEKLFEPLVTDKAGGTGLGLSVVREVAQQHGGRVDWNRESGWTCFRVELPLCVWERSRVETAGR